MKKKKFEGNFYAIGKAILYPHINMGEPRTTFGEQPLPKEIAQLNTPEYWKSMPAHPEYGNIYFPYHCAHEGILFTVKDTNGNVAGEHMRFPDARVLARRLNEEETNED